MHAKIRGTEIFYDVDGTRLVPVDGKMVERPVLFLLHGGPGGDHSSFKKEVGKLTDVAQLVYIDHRGSGRSRDSDPESWTLENNIDDLDALREHFSLERISILGSSYGGMVAQGYAIRHPDRVANLILVATASSYRFINDARCIVQERGTPEQIEICQRLWEGNFETIDQLKEYYRLLSPLYSLSSDPESFEESWGIGIRNFDQLNQGFGGFLRTFDYTDQLSQITCPTLVMAGEHDWICPPNHSRLIAKRIPSAHLKVFARSSHSIAADEPEAFLAAVRGFLTYADAG